MPSPRAAVPSAFPRFTWPAPRRRCLAAALALAAACGGAPAPVTTPVTGPDQAGQGDAAPAAPSADAAPTALLGPGGFPLPQDAVADERPGLTSTTIKTFVVERGRDAAVAELRQLLADHGWTVTRDEVSPRGSVRLEVGKDGATLKASVTGDDTRAAIIVTVPAS